MGLQGLFSKKTSIIDDSTKNKLIKMNSAPMLDIYELQLKNPICENIDGKNDKEDNLTYDRDRTQQAREYGTDNKGERITYDDNITQNDREKIGEKY